MIQSIGIPTYPTENIASIPMNIHGEKIIVNITREDTLDKIAVRINDTYLKQTGINLGIHLNDKKYIVVPDLPEPKCSVVSVS